MTRTLRALGGWLLPSVLFACGQRVERADQTNAAGAGGKPPAAPQALQLSAAPSGSTAEVPKRPEAAPTTLLTAPVSAYTATLGLDEDAGYVLTANAAYRIPVGQGAVGQPPLRWPLELGVAPALTRDRLVYWTGATLGFGPKSGGPQQPLARVPHQPQRIAASGEYVAWLDEVDGRFTIQTVSGSRPRVLLSPAGYVAALALQEDRVYFVERTDDDHWRLGRVSLSGGPAKYSPSHKGRTPAMLALTEELFYYDGPSLTVRRVSLDLDRETVLAEDVICSPLAVGKRVYCAQPAGMLEVSLDGKDRRVLPRGHEGTITSIAVSRTQLAWLVDSGANQLALEVLPIDPTTGAVR